MKKLNCSILFTSMLVFFLLSANAYAEKIPYSRNFHHDFTVKENTLFVLKNKYGKVNINNWDKNQISIDVIVKVEANSEEKAEKIFRKIEILFTESGNEARAITEIGSFNFSGEFSIDYEIKMPSTLKMDASNKFGDMFIDQCKSQSKILVEYGGLKANSFQFPNTDPFSQVNVSFGNATIEDCSYAKFNIKYSKLNMKTARVAYLITEFSTVNLTEANSIIVDSQYDTYNINKTNNVILKGRFSGIDIEQLRQKLDVDTEYGNVDVDAVSADFENIKVRSRFANVTLGMAAGASYQLDGKAKFGDIDLPDGYSKLIEKDDFSMEARGMIGNSSGATVSIDVEYGNIDLD
jgi:hypothetical protein